MKWKKSIADKSKMADKSKKKEKIKKILLDLLIVCIGCAISAYGIVGIMIPNGLSSGGITGASKIIQSISEIPFSVIYYGLTLLILIVCRIVLGWKEARKIVLLSILFPTFIAAFETFQPHLLQSKDVTLAAIYFGVFIGIGTGLIMKRGYSSGGTDTIAKMLHNKVMPFISLSQILLVIDAVVILVSGFLYGINIALYALISQIIYVKVVDFVIFGFDSKLVQIEIITSQNQLLEEYVIGEINRGVSRVNIIGAYTGVEREKLVIICSPRESMLIKNFAAGNDRDAFVSVVHLESVWGKGFEELN